ALLNNEQALGVTLVTPDADGVHRRVPLRVRTADGLVPSLAGAVLRRAGRLTMPDEVVLAPRRHLERIPTYALIDVLRAARDAPVAREAAFAGTLVLVGTTLPQEDRRLASDRFLPPAATDGPPLHPCGLRTLAASAPASTTVPGVFLFAGAIEAVE